MDSNNKGVNKTSTDPFNLTTAVVLEEFSDITASVESAEKNKAKIKDFRTIPMTE